MFRLLMCCALLFAMSTPSWAGVTVTTRTGLFGRRSVTRVTNAPRANVQVFVPNGFNGHSRANAFGTRTIIDSNGSIFEVDAFGNTRFRGNAFRGFSGGGFNSFNSFGGFNTFSSGCH